MTTTPISELFATAPFNDVAATLLAKKPEPKLRYTIAMTPRSGSSLLCSVMTATNHMGEPGEKLELRSIRNNIVKLAPARDADEYYRAVLKASATPNGVSGLKTSWFQFDLFRRSLSDERAIQESRFIYLTRRDLAAQAVSLYKATASRVFHTNKQHSPAALESLSALQYDYDRLDHWYEHLVKQERGWQRYFDSHRIFPLAITYEDIEHDVHEVVRRIALYLGLPAKGLGLARIETVFKKLGDRQSLEWASRYSLERDAARRPGADTNDAESSVR